MAKKNTNKNVLKFPSMIVRDEDFDRAFEETMFYFKGKHSKEIERIIAQALGYFEQATRDRVWLEGLLKQASQIIINNVAEEKLADSLGADKDEE